MRLPVALTALWCTGALLLGGCAPAARPALPSSEAAAATAPVLAAPSSPAPVAASDWRTVYPGLEYRELAVRVDQHPDLLRLARLDPARMRFVVRYDPGRPRRVSDWLAAEGAALVVNGGYFDPQNRALGLLIRDGMVYGQPYQGFGGMFVVGADGVQVRWNVARPYQPGEGLTQAISNFPMLVLPGGRPNTSIDENGKLSLRTAVGQDRQGRILFVVSPGAVFTLTGFGAWLAASDLDLDVALNLDGGSSSGLVVSAGAQPLGIDSWVEVPDVIVVKPR
jgi:uncharacterized protein YigE (DUF2233 family)